jgi:hypothetical protein
MDQESRRPNEDGSCPLAWCRSVALRELISERGGA